MFFEMLYSTNGVIIQFFKFFRIQMGFGSNESQYFSFLSFGIWKFDVSFVIEKDENAHDIKAKWNR